MAEDDIQIEPVNMSQSMSIAAAMVQGLILQFIKPEDEDEQKVVMTYVCLAVFLHQLCCPAKHKVKMIGVLEAVVAQLKEDRDARVD